MSYYSHLASQFQFGPGFTPEFCSNECPTVLNNWLRLGRGCFGSCKD